MATRRRAKKLPQQAIDANIQPGVLPNQQFIPGQTATRRVTRGGGRSAVVQQGQQVYTYPQMLQHFGVWLARLTPGGQQTQI